MELKSLRITRNHSWEENPDQYKAQIEVEGKNGTICLAIPPEATRQMVKQTLGTIHEFTVKAADALYKEVQLAGELPPPPEVKQVLESEKADCRITRYFTFGQNHTHSYNGRTLDKDVVMKITAADPREVMVELFDVKWAMEYEEQPSEEMFPGGVVEITR